MTTLEVGKEYIMRNGWNVTITEERVTREDKGYFLGKRTKYMNDITRGYYKFNYYGSTFGKTRPYKTDIVLEIGKINDKYKGE